MLLKLPCRFRFVISACRLNFLLLKMHIFRVGQRKSYPLFQGILTNGSLFVLKIKKCLLLGLLDKPLLQKLIEKVVGELELVARNFRVCIKTVKIGLFHCQVVHLLLYLIFTFFRAQEDAIWEMTQNFDNFFMLQLINDLEGYQG